MQTGLISVVGANGGAACVAEIEDADDDMPELEDVCCPTWMYECDKCKDCSSVD